MGIPAAKIAGFPALVSKHCKDECQDPSPSDQAAITPMVERGIFIHLLHRLSISTVIIITTSNVKHEDHRDPEFAWSDDRRSRLSFLELKLKELIHRESEGD